MARTAVTEFEPKSASHNAQRDSQSYFPLKIVRRAADAVRNAQPNIGRCHSNKTNPPAALSTKLDRTDQLHIFEIATTKILSFLPGCTPLPPPFTQLYDRSECGKLP